MKKSIFLFLVIGLIFNTMSYAECMHTYEKEYNYSLEVKKVMGYHFYRQKCLTCGEVRATENVEYELCKYENSVCTLCNEKQHLMPNYVSNVDLEFQNYLYKLCVENDIEYSFRKLLECLGPTGWSFRMNPAYDYSWLLGREDYDLSDIKDSVEIGVKLYNEYYELYGKRSSPAIVALKFGMNSPEMEAYYFMED